MTTALLRYLAVALAAAAISSCVNQGLDPIYEINRDIQLDGARALPAYVQSKVEGIYTVDGAPGRFGDTVVLKWGGGYLSMYCGNGSYAYVSGGFIDSSCTFVGYWRNALTLVSGQIQIRIAGLGQIAQLLDSARPIPPGLTLVGAFSDSVRTPTQLFALHRLSALPATLRPFLILGHRAGGRNSDYHPVSENTPGMARFAERLGANGVEIDIRLTRDGVPIIFHDDNISTRIVQQGSVVGPVNNYTYEQLIAFARLERGEPIPTLREMLDTVLAATNHRFVYLDVKTADVVAAIAPIQQEYLARAAAMGRELEIVIGMPTADVMDAFRALPDFAARPSLNELSADDARTTHSTVWAPRWTQGILIAEVAQAHADGRRVVVWTLDDPKFIRKYMAEGDFDGILTNYPAMVAYEYYTHGVK